LQNKNARKLNEHLRVFRLTFAHTTEQGILVSNELLSLFLR